MTGVLILVELGAEWPSWVEGLTARSGRRVVAQLEGESPDAFADRVAEHLSDWFTRRVPGEYVLVACNDRSDSGAMTARSKLGQALLGVLAARKASKLLFTAGGRSGLVRRALSALATDLAAAWSLDSERISVRFGGDLPLMQKAQNVA